MLLKFLGELRFNEDSFKWNKFLKEVKNKFDGIYDQVLENGIKFVDSNPDLK